MIRAGLLLMVLGAASAGCSLGQGQGKADSEHLYAPDCWGVEADPDARPAYDLGPTFFAANPSPPTMPPAPQTMQIRVQRGNDEESFSDGMLIEIDDVPAIRDHITANPSGAVETVSIEAGIRPPGAPLDPPNTPLLDAPSIVHLQLYLQDSCHNAEGAGINLNAISGTVTFIHLFSGNPNEEVGAEKYTDATFDVQVGDLQEVPVGQPVDAVPANLQSHLTGYFRFYFERGQPGQPFP